MFKEKKTNVVESTLEVRLIMQFNEHKGVKDGKQLDLELTTSTVMLRWMKICHHVHIVPHYDEWHLDTGETLMSYGHSG